MANFAEALKKGLDANQRAIDARKAVDAVLEDALKAVSETLSAPIKLGVEVVPPTLWEMVGILSAPRMKTIPALTARRDNGSPIILAEVTFSDLGFPVTVRWENRSDQADDRDSFEALLVDLLANGAIAAKIEGAISQK